MDFCNANKIIITAYFSLGGLQNKDKTIQAVGLTSEGLGARDLKSQTPNFHLKPETLHPKP